MALIVGDTSVDQLIPGGSPEAKALLTRLQVALLKGEKTPDQAAAELASGGLGAVGSPSNNAHLYWLQTGQVPTITNGVMSPAPAAPAGSPSPPKPTRTPEQIIADLKAGKIDRVGAVGQVAAWFISQGLLPQQAQQAANDYLNKVGYPSDGAEPAPVPVPKPVPVPAPSSVTVSKPSTEPAPKPETPDELARRIREQRGFPDVARRFAGGMGVPESFRDFYERAIQSQIIPFGIESAIGGFSLGSTPLHEGLQSPGKFEQFLQNRLNAPKEPGEEDGGLLDPGAIGTALRRAAAFLRIPSQKGDVANLAGRDFLGNMLQGPSGSVGSELFAPTISLATQGSGRRLFPQFGEAARGAQRSALTTMLAENPNRFTDLASFIEYLVSQGVI